MTLQPTIYERERLREIAREYQEQGYEVLVQPSPEQLPAFLAPFHINMLAHNNEENVVVEVRTQASLTNAPELDAIAQVLQDKHAWRFELVVSNPRDRSALPFKDAKSLDHLDITSRLDEARELSDQEHGEAALLLAWSATEALLRHIADVEAISVVGHNPGQVAKSLYTYGVLDKEQYQMLQEGLETRNILVHGYTKQRPLADALGQLLRVADQLQRRYQHS